MQRMLALVVVLGIVFSVTNAQAQAPTPTPRSGLADLAAAKAAVKCQKALTKSGSTFATTKLASLTKCVDTLFRCVQLKPTDPKCFSKAELTCSKQFDKIIAAESKLRASITSKSSKCDGPDLSPANLLDELGLGFGRPESTALCAQVGVPSVNSATDIADCLVNHTECRVEEIFAGQAPLSGYLLGLIGRDVRSDFCGPTSAPTPTSTAIGATPSATPTVIAPTTTATASESSTPTPETGVPTDTPTPTETPTAAETPTSAETPTETATETPEPTPTAEATTEETATPETTATPEPTATPEEAATPEETPTPDETPTPGEAPTPEETPTPEQTP